jgi:hypothetical protein
MRMSSTSDAASVPGKEGARREPAPAGLSLVEVEVEVEVEVARDQDSAGAYSRPWTGPIPLNVSWMLAPSR